MARMLTWFLFCAAASWAQPRFSSDQLGAKFYYDLGPTELDVALYPKEQQENYLKFKRACSQCHTLARPINSPITERKEWSRYVQRMHTHARNRPGAVLSKEDALAIVDFLVYDSGVRKKKAEFLARSAELKNLFKEVQGERANRKP